MYSDISLVITHDEARELFYKHNDPIRAKYPWTGVDECGDPESEIEYVYSWMGCGRTSWGVAWEDVSERARKKLQGLKDMFLSDRDKVYIIFTSRKEVYPPVFLLKLYP